MKRLVLCGEEVFAKGSGACCCDYGTKESPWVLWNDNKRGSMRTEQHELQLTLSIDAKVNLVDLRVGNKLETFG